MRNNILWNYKNCLHKQDKACFTDIQRVVPQKTDLAKAHAIYNVEKRARPSDSAINDHVTPQGAHVNMFYWLCLCPPGLADVNFNPKE